MEPRNRFQGINSANLCGPLGQTQNCLKLSKPGFSYNCLPVSCGDVSFWKKVLGLVLPLKSGLKLLMLPLGPSCLLQTILLSDLVGCDRPLHFLLKFEVCQNSNYCPQRAVTTYWPRKFRVKKSASTCHYYLQQAVTPDWMGSVALWEHIMASFSRAENPLRT